MIGVGAVFKFNSGRPEFRRSPEWMIEMKLEWLYRVFQEPRRMGKRYWHVFVSMPRLIMDELKINKSHATNKHARKQ
jgi:N-acetylglucosaminyldiphosphoundecaprenol N-acetyl-beta-D-mannosaminyltransferase